MAQLKLSKVKFNFFYFYFENGDLLRLFLWEKIWVRGFGKKPATKKKGKKALAVI